MNADQPSNKSGKSKLTDEDLLANAIPIDASELEEVGEESQSPKSRSSRRTEEPEAIEIVEGDDSDRSPPRIQTIGERSHQAQKKSWKRQANVTGNGAVRVKSFVAKLRTEAIEHMDEQINDWLDAHPEYEVKFVTTAVGQLTGKITEEALFVNVWV